MYSLENHEKKVKDESNCVDLGCQLFHLLYFLALKMLIGATCHCKY